MASIYLIRHGQASFGKADYDQLSTLGCQQARLLGEYWQPVMSTLTQFYCGDLLRHGQTLQHFQFGLNNQTNELEKKHNHLNDSSSEIPLSRIHSGFNEFDHIDILTRYNPEWNNATAILSELANNPVAESTKPQSQNGLLQQHLFSALQRWMNAKYNSEYQESWPQFKQRCCRALQDIIAQSLASKKLRSAQQDRFLGQPAKTQSDVILVFTSAGTIAAILQQILELSDHQTLLMSQQIRNTSVSKLLFTSNQLSVDYYNNFSHLAIGEAGLISFR